MESLDNIGGALFLTSGEAQAGFVDVTAEGVRLPDLPCRYVKLSNLSVIEDLTTANAVTIFYGFAGNLAHELFPGDTTQLIPVQNATQIFVRTRSLLTARLYFSYYK